MRLVFPLIVLLSAVTAFATEAADPAQLARALESPSFAERNQATLGLRALGQKAHDALIHAAESGSAEVRTRTLSILQQQMYSSDSDLQLAAKAALNTLAKGNSAAARMAHSILHPAAPDAERVQQLRLQRALQMGLIGGRLQIQANGPPPAPQLPAAVGRYSITTFENGRKITVKGSEKGIQIEVTETNKDGKRVTNRYEAKNAAELKANHPEASRLFEEMRQRFGLRDPNP